MDFGTILIVGVLVLAPAAIVLTIFTVVRRRREKFHRQRITKNRSSKPHQ